MPRGVREEVGKQPASSWGKPQSQQQQGVIDVEAVEADAVIEDAREWLCHFLLTKQRTEKEKISQ